MEHLEDKIISEKVNSLTDLPSGYAPSLEGKWGLIENTLPEKKRYRKMIFAIAASLLLLIGFSILYFHKAKKQKPEIVFQDHINNSTKHASGEIIKRQKVESTVETPVNKSIEGVKIQNKNTKNSILNNPLVVKMQTIDSAGFIEEDKNILPENATTSKLAGTKKSKKLYVEIDFNDVPQIQKKTENKVAENKVKFKVSIFKNKNKITETSPPATVLKISKEFPLNN